MSAPPRMVCPECGNRTVVPMAYGYPGAGMFGAAERDEIILGGCCVPGLYSHGCTACGWRKRWDNSPNDAIGPT